MANATISVRVDEELKEQAQVMFKSWGLDLSTAINIFLSQSVREHRIPFEIGDEIPNEETIKAMEEADEIARKGEYRFTSPEEMFKELGI